MTIVKYIHFQRYTSYEYAIKLRFREVFGEVCLRYNNLSTDGVEFGLYRFLAYDSETFPDVDKYIVIIINNNKIILLKIDIKLGQKRVELQRKDFNYMAFT